MFEKVIAFLSQLVEVVKEWIKKKEANDRVERVLTLQEARDMYDVAAKLPMHTKEQREFRQSEIEKAMREYRKAMSGKV